VHHGEPLLAPNERDVVADALRYGSEERHRLLAFVVMDDHIHVVVIPIRDSLDRLVHSWKSYTAHRLQRLRGRSGAVWQQESFDRVIRDEGELQQKIDYVARNPWKRWPGLKDYRWVWVRGR
jgi:REP element-mobilizing transposase RayT